MQWMYLAAYIVLQTEIRHFLIKRGFKIDFERKIISKRWMGLKREKSSGNRKIEGRFLRVLEIIVDKSVYKRGNRG